ncbi:hypothetical protein DFH09DRAFT_494372 [Mycena vulgaris]|nr:hypothetical protein DFH09DRAFT_494372 [Mycena vulgaris]
MFQADLAFLRQIGPKLESLEVHRLEQEAEESNYFLAPLDFTPGAFPLLRRLVFGPAERGTPLCDFWLAFFNDAPQLRELTLLREVETASTPLPWHQLTKFTGYNFPLDECLEVLRLAPDLEECTFIVEICAPSTPPQAVTHPHLKTLCLLPDSDGEGWADILTFLTLPAVETFHLERIPKVEASILQTLLSRSSAPLRKLTVCPPKWGQYGQWESCFRLMDLIWRSYISPAQTRRFKPNSSKHLAQVKNSFSRSSAISFSTTPAPS